MQIFPCRFYNVFILCVWIFFNGFLSCVNISIGFGTRLLFCLCRHFLMVSKLCKHFHIVSRAGCDGGNASYWAPHRGSPSMSEIATKIIFLAPGTSPIIIPNFSDFSYKIVFANIVTETAGLIQNLWPLGQTNWIPPLESNYPLLFKSGCSPLDMSHYEGEKIWTRPYSFSIHDEDGE